MDKKVRLNKYIASCTDISRRAADELISLGKVKVNGKIVSELGITLGGKDTVIIDGKPIVPQKHEYYAFHKPAGYITTKSDPQKRKTIYNILPESLKSLNPAGRLDKDSSGLIILTNDGDLLLKLTHPKIKVAKVYKVTIKGKLSQGDIYKLENGIEIEPGKVAYAEVEMLEYKKGISMLKVTLHQGYNRQIRKMMESIGHPIQALKRISHATINISGLEKGQYRKINIKELKNLNIYLNKKMNDLYKKEKKSCAETQL
ncbi:MAG: pseudouridine synthase [Candidatus Gastranaerophilales bacterium]|nr:pseudouridine synthase [Candidatus Gastranaerophilales bacterium]